MKLFIVYVSCMFLLLTGMVYAVDSNGVWHYAEDIRPGIIGDDEVTGNYTFQSGVNFNSRIIAPDLIDYDDDDYYLNPSGNTYLRNLFVDYFNPGGNVKLDAFKSCNKLFTDSNGLISCGSDAVDDADNNPTNELQTLSISGNRLSISDGNSVSIPSDGDGDSTNELQNLTISGNQLSISSGNSVNLPSMTETDPTVPANIKDGISWSEISDIPSGFADGVDNSQTAGVNIYSCSVVRDVHSCGTSCTGGLSTSSTCYYWDDDSSDDDCAYYRTRNCAYVGRLIS
ncbi:MAG: hypothetical protein ACOCXG_01240 [Nanoarchaeota archaeon]